jgi:phage portal protein BeeE
MGVIPGRTLSPVGIMNRLATLTRAADAAQLEATSVADEPRGRFAVDADSGVLYGTPTLDDLIYMRGRISKAEALRCPPVKKARDLIAAIGQFPLHVLDPNGRPADTFRPNLFEQPEEGIAPSVTWAHVVEDMLLCERAWIERVAVGWHGRIVTGRRLDAETVTVQPEYKQTPYGSATVWPTIDGLIRIDSPNGGLLDSSPTIRAYILLERATLNAVNGVPPIDYFTPADDADPLEDDEEVAAILDQWAENRRTRRTAYVPASLKYNVAGWDPEKLQLAEARKDAALEVARITGIDPYDLGVSTSTKNYANQQDRRRDRVEDVLGPYMTAIESRLSMDDITPHGYTVRFDTSAYLRLDDSLAATSDAALIAARVLTPNEARAKRGLEPLEGGDTFPDPKPAPAREKADA